MKDASGIIIGTPVYFWDMTAQAKTIIDRTIAFQPFGQPLANIVGGAIVVAGSTGTVDVVKNLYMFFGAHRIFPVNWVAVYSPVHEKEEGMKSAFNLGKEIVQVAKNKPEFSSSFVPHHFAFGTHTH